MEPEAERGEEESEEEVAAAQLELAREHWHAMSYDEAMQYPFLLEMAVERGWAVPREPCGAGCRCAACWAEPMPPEPFFHASEAAQARRRRDVRVADFETWWPRSVRVRALRR